MVFMDLIWVDILIILVLATHVYNVAHGYLFCVVHPVVHRIFNISYVRS